MVPRLAAGHQKALRFGVKLLAAAVWLAAFATAQDPADGPRAATFFSSVDRSQQPYALYIPKAYDPAKKYPLVLSLHSEESNHRLNLKQTFGVTSRYGELDSVNLRYNPPFPDVNAFVVCPLARGTMGYEGIAEKDVYDVVAEVERQFNIDRDRVYLTGISMGGGGAMRLALTRPDLWAAVMPLCPETPAGLDDLAGNALNVPMRLYQGDADPIVPVAAVRGWYRKLLDLSDPVEYLEIPTLRHNAWDAAYRGRAEFDWFAKFKRNRFPERVRFATSSYRYGAAYWVRIDSLTPGSLATVDARRTGAAQVQVQTSGLVGLTLSLDRPLSAVSIDGAAVRIRPGATHSFVKTARGWASGMAPATAKRAGAEGPIVEAVSARHIYVYGSLGTRTADELEARRRIAQSAAAWSNAREHLTLTLAVKADSEVTADDIDSADLVLFGTADTNSVIARMAGNLPLALNAGAADYGLLFIAPVGKHYVLVSSGMPWWTGADPSRGTDPFAPAQYRLLSTLGDYVLFRGSIANVVAEGRFDANWKVPAEAAAKMASTGTVTVRSQ